jgi:glutaminyl-tRNA synthetase
LEHCVREDLAGRVESRNVVENPIKVIITNYPEGILEEMEMENNRNVPEMGSRRVPFGREILIDGDDFMEVPSKGYFRLYPGNEVRLKGAYFITCTEAIKDDLGNVLEIHCTYDPQTRSGEGFEGRKVKGTIHWVEATTALPITVRHYEYLMTDNESGESRINPDSVKELNAFSEPSLTAVRPGDRFQFFRHGYYIADSRLTMEDHRIFNRIVDLKSSFKVMK